MPNENMCFNVKMPRARPKTTPMKTASNVGEETPVIQCESVPNGVVGMFVGALADKILADVDVGCLRAAITGKLVERLLHDEALLPHMHAALAAKLAERLLDSVMQDDIVEAILQKSLQS